VHALGKTNWSKFVFGAWTTKSILSDIIGMRIVRNSCHQHLRKFI